MIRTKKKGNNLKTHRRDWFHWSTGDCEESPRPIICRWWSVANEWWSWWWSLSWKTAEPPDSFEFALMEEEEDIEEEEDTFHQLPEFMKSWWSPIAFFVITMCVIYIYVGEDLNLLRLLRLCFTWNDDEDPHERDTYSCKYLSIYIGYFSFFW